MDKKVIKKECTVGFKCWYENEPNKVWYEQGETGQGFVFKDEDAFNSKETVVCYIPELDSYWEGLEDDFEGELEKTDGNTITCGYTYSDFLNLCDGVEYLAMCLFNDVDWQHPETLLGEWADGRISDMFENIGVEAEEAHRLADIYDEERDGSDWGDLYRFYLKHKNQ